MLETLASVVGTALAFAIFLYALVVGGKAERTVAVAMILAWILSGVAAGERNTFDPHWGVFWVDVALFALLVVVVLKSRKAWTYVAAAAHLIGTISHAVAALDLRIFIKTYVTLFVAASYFATAALAWGAAEHHLKRLSLKR